MEAEVEERLSRGWQFIRLLSKYVICPIVHLDWVAKHEVVRFRVIPTCSTGTFGFAHLDDQRVSDAVVVCE